MATSCLGKNREGGPCGAYVPEGREWCQFHDPALAEDRKKWSAKGGKNRSNRARARKETENDTLSPKDLQGVLSRTVRRLESGQAEPGVANAIANVAKALAALQDSVSVDARLTALEERDGIVYLDDRRHA